MLHFFVGFFLVLALAQEFVISGGDDMVQCYSRTDNCVGPSRFTTRAECCDNRGKEPAQFGFSVRTDDEGCRRCPIS